MLLEDPDLDPYGPDNPAHAADAGFAEFFTSGLAAAIERFRGRSADWRTTLAGGIVRQSAKRPRKRSIAVARPEVKNSAKPASATWAGLSGPSGSRSGSSSSAGRPPPVTDVPSQ